MRILWAISVVSTLVATVLAVENSFLRAKNEPSLEQVRRAVMKNVKPGLARNKYDPQVMFNADVALPAGFKTVFHRDPARLEAFGGTTFQKMSVAEETQSVGFITGDDRRSLQDIALLLCFPEDDGNIFCVGDDYPTLGLITVFVCPELATTVDQCSWCYIFWEDEPANITTATPTCTDCVVCSTFDSVDYSFNCSNISPGDPCASQDCSGNCTGSANGNPCFQQPDGSYDCAVEDIPNDELVLVFTGCNLTTASSIFDCPTCEIVEADSYGNITDESARCNSCSVCPVELNVAFDCSNFDDVDPCAVQSCNSTCLGAPSAPTPEPVPPPTENLCYPQSDGSFDCVIEDAPRDDLTMVFTGCDLTTATSIFDCPMCYIADSDSYLGITNSTTRCNSCTVCDGQPNVAWDCVNIDPGEDCAIRDCDTNCLNIDRAPSPPSPSLGYDFDPPAYAPSPTSGASRGVYPLSVVLIIVASVLLR